MAEIVHIVCSDRFAGVERYISYVTPVLADRGHRVRVIGGNAPRMRAALHGTGVRFDPARSPLEVTRRLVAARPIDLVHAHMTNAEGVAVLTRPLTRARCVATVHFAQPRGANRLRRFLANGLANGVQAEIAISEHVERASGSQRAVVIPNGVAWDEPPARREQVVLAAQRLEQEKDGASLIRAWVRSGLGSAGWRLEFAGEGSQERQLRQLAEDLGAAGTIEFLGNVPDLPRRMARSSMFLTTAPDEPFGLSVVEAMAAGLAVVATGTGAHLETMGTLADAPLFAPGDVDAAAAALCLLAQDPERRAALGSHLQEIFHERYTIDRHVDALTELYARVLGEGHIEEAGGP